MIANDLIKSLTYANFAMFVRMIDLKNKKLLLVSIKTKNTLRQTLHKEDNLESSKTFERGSDM
jgi:hypothetical protein